jgi:anti-anti-sigma factor
MTTSPPPPHAPGSIRFAAEDGGIVLHLTGEIDSATVADYRRTAPRDAEPPALLLIDASAVTFMNSVGAGFLLEQTTAARQAGVRPLLRRPSRAALQVLRLTGLDLLFELID